MNENDGEVCKGPNPLGGSNPGADVSFDLNFNPAEPTESDLREAAKLRFAEVTKLARTGFRFSPAEIGATHGIRDWQRLATSDPARLAQWVNPSTQLVMVACRDAGTALDIDDFGAAVALGFDPEWVEGCYRLATPSGDGHCSIWLPRDPEFAGLPDAAVLNICTPDGKIVLEWKLRVSTVAGPWSWRKPDPERPKKPAGWYLPEKGTAPVRCPNPKALAEWAKTCARKPKPRFNGPSGKFEFHEDFCLADFLDNEGCTEKRQGMVNGALHVEVEQCPHCDAPARNSTLEAAVSKFLFGGSGFGYICHHCGIASREEHEAAMKEADPAYKPWSGCIYRSDDPELLFGDAPPEMQPRLVGNPAGQDSPETEAKEDEDAAVEPDSQALFVPENDIESYAYARSDMGNAERLVRRFGHVIHWVSEINAWMVWGRNGWRRDSGRILMRMTKAVVDEIRRQARGEWNEAFPEQLRKDIEEAEAVIAEAKEHKVERQRLIEAKQALRDAYSSDQIDKEKKESSQKLLKHSVDSGRLERRKAMIASAGFERGVFTRLSEWDSDPWLLNVRNGVIDLRTQSFRARTQRDLCMRQAPVDYDPEAKCPLWEAAMLRWMCGDRELVAYLQAALGLTLTSDTSQQCFFFLEGGGENGKDTFLSAVKFVLGDYAKDVNITTLLESRWGHSEHRNDLAALAGAARMVTAAETGEGHHWDEGTIKNLTGGMTLVTCREIHGKPFSFLPQFKLWVMSNYAPVIKGSDWAIWRRVKRIPWNYDFNAHPEEKDTRFGKRLKAEAPGILNWMLAGLRAYIENGYALPECRAVRQFTDQYRADMDILGRFTQECLVFRRSGAAVRQRIYREYKRWCDENEERPIKARRFFAELTKRHPGLREEGSGGTLQILGVEVLFDPQAPGPEALGGGE